MYSAWIVDDFHIRISRQTFTTGWGITWTKYRGPGQVQFDSAVTPLDVNGEEAVATATFNGKNPFPFQRDPIQRNYFKRNGSTENMLVTKRFTRVDDETMWARSWSAELSLKKTIGPIFEHACHEGNYGWYNTLVGARLEEKLAAEEAAARKSN